MRACHFGHHDVNDLIPYYAIRAHVSSSCATPDICNIWCYGMCVLACTHGQRMGIHNVYVLVHTHCVKERICSIGSRCVYRHTLSSGLTLRSGAWNPS